MRNEIDSNILEGKNGRTLWREWNGIWNFYTNKVCNAIVWSIYEDFFYDFNLYFFFFFKKMQSKESKNSEKK